MSYLSSTFLVPLMVFGMAAVGAVVAGESENGDARARRFIRTHEETIRPLEIAVARAWWDANVSGKDEDYRRKEEAETRLDLALSDPKRFAELKTIRQGPIHNGLVKRQLDVLYLQYLPKQVAPELLKQILAVSNKAEKAFSVFRAEVKGRELSQNEVRRVLRESKDSAERRAVWEASKRVGPAIEADLKRLVKLRNEAARKLGFKDYHVMALVASEQSQEQVLRLFDELDRLTQDAFHEAKTEIDAALARGYGIKVEDLRPWHYHDPYFQESPEVFGKPSDELYKSIDILAMCREFYAGIGLPVDDVLRRSDLYEHKGKNPHAFCTDIDREGDVRVLANIVPGKEWLSTMLHELGHSVYSSKNIPREVPYVLRTDAHALSTEAVAMMFEAFADNAQWLQAMGVKVPDPEGFNRTTAKLRRNQQLIFSRWCQVMFRFEKELYGNPDQDLNRAWWDLVEKYQEVRRPEGRSAPDYASKIHVILAPAYYHNYMMGELFACQVRHAIARDVFQGASPRRLGPYVGNRGVGRFMQERVFDAGRKLDWNGLSKHATGAELNPKAFAADLGTVATPEGEPAAKPAGAKTRIGVYDSRAIAVAFVGSAAYRASSGKQLADMKAEYDKAKAEGNQKRIAELEKQGKAQQVLLHKQGFSTAPVNDILKHIKDKMPEIAKAAGVGPIVSKWDKDALAKYKPAELVDVTMALVDAFRPNERQRKSAIDIQKHPPISLEEAEKIDD